MKRYFPREGGRSSGRAFPRVVRSGTLLLAGPESFSPSSDDRTCMLLAGEFEEMLRHPAHIAGADAGALKALATDPTCCAETRAQSALPAI